MQGKLFAHPAAQRINEKDICCEGETCMSEEQSIQTETGSQDVLSRIEALLIEQNKHTQKMLRSSRLRNILLIIIAAAFVITAVAFYGTLQTLTKDIPDLIAQARSLISNTNRAVEDITGKVDELNIDALNESIEGIASINYKGLNTSISGLASAVDSFETFVDNLSRPANAISSIFGG